LPIFRSVGSDHADRNEKAAFEDLRLFCHEGSINVLVESDIDRFAPHNRWRPQIAGWAEHLTHERVVGRVLLHVKRYDLLSLGDMNDVGGFRQRKRLGSAFLFLVRIDRCLDFYLVLLKEPLSFLARRSAIAVIHPINIRRHGFSSKGNYSIVPCKYALRVVGSNFSIA
jgi:hypothetical protein